jgi:hypothetical protein
MFSYRALVCWLVYFNEKLGLWSIPSNFNTAIFAVRFELAYSEPWSVHCICFRIMRLKWSGQLYKQQFFFCEWKDRVCIYSGHNDFWLGRPILRLTLPFVITVYWKVKVKLSLFTPQGHIDSTHFHPSLISALDRSEGQLHNPATFLAGKELG